MLCYAYESVEVDVPLSSIWYAFPLLLRLGAVYKFNCRNPLQRLQPLLSDPLQPPNVLDSGMRQDHFLDDTCSVQFTTSHSGSVQVIQYKQLVGNEQDASVQKDIDKAVDTLVQQLRLQV